jgi:acetylornithine deacetylase
VHELTRLIADLVAIDSVNPDLIPGGAGERAIARMVGLWLADAGLEVELLEEVPGRPSVVAIARGSGGGRSLMLNAHMDTVGVGAMEAPFEPRIEGTRLYGRGAYDMKASLAAIMLAGREAADAGLRGDVIVTAVADEEVGSIGTEAVLRRFGADAAIVTEPTAERVGVAHKGFVAFEIETVGRAAHGSRPDVGVDAIAKMGHVLVGLEALDETLRASQTHPLLGSGSVHASVVAGGQEFSSYPERCLLQAERRTIPGETVVRAEQEIRMLIEELAAGDPQFVGSSRAVFSREPFEIDESEPIVELVSRQAGGAQRGGEAFWADSALLAAAGIPTVLFGPAGDGAHAAVEWVDLTSAQRCREVYAAVAAELCA